MPVHRNMHLLRDTINMSQQAFTKDRPKDLYPVPGCPHSASIAVTATIGFSQIQLQWKYGRVLQLSSHQ